jgi:hypothetical protein
MAEMKGANKNAEGAGAMWPEQEEVEVGLKDVIRPGVTRGLDFIIIDELRKRTGITPNSVLKFALGEMLCNSLDKDDATEIDIDLRSEGKFHRLKVSDNGSKKLTLEEIKLILNFDYKASSKRGFHRVSRGYLGNALKCIFGYSYALAESKGLAPPDIVVGSASNEYRIVLRPNRVKGVIESEIVATERSDNECTTFIVKFPRDGLNADPQALKDLIFASSMVNPQRKITYNIFGEKGELGSAEGGKAIRRETSVLWYTEKQFQSLFEDFLRARPETQLKEFISLFRGFTSKAIIREILQNLNSANHDSRKNPRVQFLPVTPIQEFSTGAVSELFRMMRAKAKPIAKRSIGSVLGFVGEESFEEIRKQQGWERLRYTMIPSTQIECPELFHDVTPCDNPDHVEFPCLVELAVFDRKDDGEGLKVYQCVNFMASMEDIFSRIFDIGYRLGRVGIKAETPVTVVAHLVCPVLKWLNYGKSGLDE